MTSPAQVWTTRSAGWLVPIAAFVCGLGWQGIMAASASSVPTVQAAEHARHCKCAEKCSGASCCCGPRPPRARKATPGPIASTARTPSGPCLNAAPCGDPVVPGAPAASPVGKAATLSIVWSPGPDARGRLLPSHPGCTRPARRASRLDDPPESPASA